MKILLVGSDKIYAIENFYAKHLAEQGTEVVHVSAQSMFYDYYNRSFRNRVLFKLGISSIYTKINRHVLEQIEETKPDIVWIFKGMEIFPETLKRIRDRKIILVNYNPDNPFLFSGKGSGNKNVSDSIPLYDLHFTYNLEIQEQLRALNLRTSYLPFGYEVPDSLMPELLALDEQNKMCFIGNPDHERAAFINNLLKAGLKIDLVGNSWSQFISHDNATIFQPAYGDDQWRVLRKYRVQLNLLRKHNLNSHNMRTFEVPGVGGIMVAPRTVEHVSFFDHGKEAFFFNDLDECARHCFELMSFSKLEAANIREAAMNRCAISGYDYKSRASFALAEIKKL